MSFVLSQVRAALSLLWLEDKYSGKSDWPWFLQGSTDYTAE